MPVTSESTSPRLVRTRARRSRIAGVEVEALSISHLNEIVVRAIEAGDHIVVANHNLHSIYLYHHDSKMRRFYSAADHIHVDGMAIIGLGRVLGMPLSREHRVTFVDWMEPLASVAAKYGWRVFYLGSRPGVAEKGAEVLRHRHPGLQIKTSHGFFDRDPVSREAQVTLADIETYRPQLLIVGMGMPRQEHWIVDHLDKLTANVILNGGAALDYFAGAIPTPPRWAGRVGLEWLFRLASEPRRLWSRYLIEPWYIACKVVGEIFARRQCSPRDYD